MAEKEGVLLSEVIRRAVRAYAERKDADVKSA
jgi:hypothetical protein